MKPLLSRDLNNFLGRFENFKDGEFRSIEILSPTTMKATIAAQDTAREFNWITIEFEFNGVEDAKIVDNSKLAYIDMSDGISIKNEDNKFAFGIGKGYNLSNINNAVCYFVSSSIKYKESEFLNY